METKQPGSYIFVYESVYSSSDIKTSLCRVVEHAEDFISVITLSKGEYGNIECQSRNLSTNLDNKKLRINYNPTDEEVDHFLIAHAFEDKLRTAFTQALEQFKAARMRQDLFNTNFKHLDKTPQLEYAESVPAPKSVNIEDEIPF